MQVAFAAVGGLEIDVHMLEEGTSSIGERADFDEVALTADVSFSIRVHVPWTGEHSAWCLVELHGEDGLSTLVEAARTIAARAGRTVRAVASVVEREIGAGRVEIGYRAYDVSPDGKTETLSIDQADRACGVVDEDSTDELGDLLAILVDDSAPQVTRPRGGGRCFRRKPLLEDPRLARLAGTIAMAKSVEYDPDGPDSVRVRVVGNDGVKRIAVITSDEADAVRRATLRP
jgi:hypothetical protein